MFRDLLLNFGTLLISLERLKLRTSNFAGKLSVSYTKQKIGKEGVTYLTLPTFQF